MNSEYGLTKKEYLKNIADAIRGKNGETNTIKVKEMANAISGLSNGKFKPELSFNLILHDNTSDSLKTKMECGFVDKNGVELIRTGINNAALKLYKKTDDGDEYITTLNTLNNGECTFYISEKPYGKLKVVFDGSEKFEALSVDYSPEMLEVTFVLVYSEDAAQYGPTFYIGDNEIKYNGDCYFKWMNEDEIRYTGQSILKENLEWGNTYKFSFRGNITGVKRDTFGRDGCTEVKLPESMIDSETLFPLSNQLFKTVELPKLISKLPDGCFYEDTELVYINLPEKITVIPNSCFYSCYSLKKVGMDNVIEFGEEAFGDCEFKTLKLPNNLKYIHKNCFVDCEYLEYLELPNSLLSVGYSDDWRSKSEFVSNTPNLKYMNIPPNIHSQYNPYDALNPFKQVPAYFFGKGSAIEHIVIPATVKQFHTTDWYSGLEDNAFKELPNLKSITFRGFDVPSKIDDDTDTWERYFDDYLELYGRSIIVYLPENHSSRYNDFLYSSKKNRFIVLTTPNIYTNPIYIWDVTGKTNSRVEVFDLNDDLVGAGNYNENEHCYVANEIETGDYKIIVNEQERFVHVDQDYENIFYFHGQSVNNELYDYLYEFDGDYNEL